MVLSLLPRYKEELRNTEAPLASRRSLRYRSIDTDNHHDGKEMHHVPSVRFVFACYAWKSEWCCRNCDDYLTCLLITVLGRNGRLEG
jgi:hypothetical protein